MDYKDRFWKYVNKDGPIHPIHGQCWSGLVVEAVMAMELLN